MATWETLLHDVRLQLQDTSATPRWSDETLWAFCKDAVNDYSIWFPRRVDRKELTGTTSYPLPADFVDAIEVESPAETFLKERHTRAGYTYLSQSSPLFYYIEGGSLYLNGSPPDDSEVLLTYFATHPYPINYQDTTFVFTIPEVDLELIRLYIRAQVHIQMRGKQARLDRFEPGSGRRDDNPLKPETSELMLEYYQKLSSRSPGGAVVLYRPGVRR